MTDFLKNYYVNENSVFVKDIRDDAYLMNVYKYAAVNAVSSLTSYWSTEEAQKIISDLSFGFVWNSFPDVRNDLVNICVNICRTNSNTRVKSISSDFALSFLEKLHEDIPEDDDFGHNSLRAKLIAVLEPGFDYLSELNKFSLSPTDEDVYNMWKSAGLRFSHDSSFFDYLWAKVKRSQGAIEKKKEIINSALDNNAVSMNLYKKIAKSSPVSIKRIVAESLEKRMREQSRRVSRIERDSSQYPEEFRVSESKKVAQLEEVAMLFVGCTDYRVVESLIGCLSRENLPWLMPSASDHYWLSQRISEALERE